MGGRGERVLRRMARLADGWFPLSPPDEALSATLARLHDDLAARWRDIGAQYLAVNTMGAGLEPHQHLETLRRFKEEWGALG